LDAGIQNDKDLIKNIIKRPQPEDDMVDPARPAPRRRDRLDDIIKPMSISGIVKRPSVDDNRKKLDIEKVIKGMQDKKKNEYLRLVDGVKPEDVIRKRQKRKDKKTEFFSDLIDKQPPSLPLTPVQRNIVSKFDLVKDENEINQEQKREDAKDVIRDIIKGLDGAPIDAKTRNKVVKVLRDHTDLIHFIKDKGFKVPVDLFEQIEKMNTTDIYSKVKSYFSNNEIKFKFKKRYKDRMWRNGKNPR